jgi:hypothetical protein
MIKQKSLSDFGLQANKSCQHSESQFKRDEAVSRGVAAFDELGERLRPGR